LTEAYRQYRKKQLKNNGDDHVMQDTDVQHKKHRISSHDNDPK